MSTQQTMQPFQVEGQAYQTPFTRGRRQTAQRELAKAGQRVVIGMQAPCNETEGYTLIGRLFELARTEYSRLVAVEQQSQQNLRRIGFATPRRVVRIYGAQIQQCNNRNDKPCQVLRRKILCKGHRLLQRLPVIDGFKSFLPYVALYHHWNGRDRASLRLIASV